MESQRDVGEWVWYQAIILYNTVSIEDRDGWETGLTLCQKKRTSIIMRQMASITADHPILASIRLYDYVEDISEC